MSKQQEEEKFNQLNHANWKRIFFDSGINDKLWNGYNVHENYQDKWFLDGKIGSVENTINGMQLTAGPRMFDDNHHMVLWTKQSFRGDLKIEFDYTVLDFANRCVNIIYIQATGAENIGVNRDIAKWERKTPSMSEYFNKMNTYHISIAAYDNQNNNDKKDYIRLRRYCPIKDKTDGLINTEIMPEYFDTGFFQPNISHHIKIIKRKQEIIMQITAQNITKYFIWNNTIAPPIIEGRIGLRLMFTRSALFKNFTIYEIDK